MKTRKNRGHHADHTLATLFHPAIVHYSLFVRYREPAAALVWQRAFKIKGFPWIWENGLTRLKPCRNVLRLKVTMDKGIVMSSLQNARFEALRSAPPDSWVAFSDDETQIIAIGKTYDEVVAASTNAGVADPVIVKTPVMWSAFSV